MRPALLLFTALLATAALRGGTPPLHPQARVETELEGGREGRLPLSFNAASRTWFSRLQGAGWVLEQRSDLPGKPPALLSVWSKNGQRHSLLLTAESAGATRFLLFPHPKSP